MKEMCSNDSVLDLFLSETLEQMIQLKQFMITIENKNNFKGNTINEVFRIIHTLKKESNKVKYYIVSNLVQSLEDVFYYLWIKKPNDIDFSVLSVLVFEIMDFIKLEFNKIRKNVNTEHDAAILIDTLKAYLFVLNRGDIPITPKLEEELYQKLSNE